MNDAPVTPSALSAVELPDPEFKRRAKSLVGVDEVVSGLTTELSMVLRPHTFDEWAKRKGLGPELLRLIKRRSPLFILAGDVGTGKTEIAETIGDNLAREWDLPITLFRLGLSARGSGLVGEMSRLIAGGFDEVIRTGRRWSGGKSARAAGILFIDEADALAQSRELGQMHHEDRAGVNALIRGIDDLGRAEIPVAILMATNRLASLDPAVLRRSGRIFELDRPNEAQRGALFQRFLGSLPELHTGLDELVSITGPEGARRYGFTYSDLTQRLIPTAILSEYPDGTPTISTLIKTAKAIEPTPAFQAKAVHRSV
jgi:SpoVK/Ycf46/Vps4 family AAA+-type ATPase